MEGIENTFQDTIKDILQAGPDKFDVERMRTIVDRFLLRRQVAVENGPHEVIPSVVVADMLYSTENKGLVEFLRNGGIQNAENMRKRKAEYWLDLLKETLCQCNEKHPRVLLLS